MRAKITAGNWKMNKSLEEGQELVEGILEGLESPNGIVILCVPHTHIQQTESQINGKPHVFLGAQNCHHETNGAYTGEISAPMLADMGVDFVIVGHSERRAYNKENSKLLAQKVDAVLEAGMQPIFCCGESLAIRERGTRARYVNKQLRDGLFHLSAEDFEKVVIAYEPIWAIGTGVTASSAQAQEMHASIRAKIKRKYGKEIAANTSILYGGSCKPSNAEELFGQPDVDGGLIGGASLKPDLFLGVIGAM